MPHRNILAIVNPASQNGALGRRWSSVAPLIKRHIPTCEWTFTTEPGDATKLAREGLERGIPSIVAVGGDGTINEVLNGFFRDKKAITPEATLGIVPFGTGGDFRKTLQIPTNVEEALRIIAAGKRRSVDVGSVDFVDHDDNEASRMFANIASFGLSGAVDDEVNRGSKRFGGKATFLYATVKVGMRYQAQRVRLTFDGVDYEPTEMAINLVAVANGRFFGGGMQVAPKALVDDGQFDVVAIGDMGSLRFLRHSRRLYHGTHLELPEVSHRRAMRLRAEPIADEAVLLDVDGEAPGRLPATFEILPGAVRVFAP